MKTAVEWLIETFNITNVDLSHHKLIIEQAKEMEKQQIIDAYHINPLETKFGNIGEQYYVETFKSE